MEHVDVAARKHAEDALRNQTRRLETFNRLSKSITTDLDLERIVQAVTDIATELSGAKFGAFFYNVTDGKGERYLLYTLSGAPREAFARFGVAAQYRTLPANLCRYRRRSLRRYSH